MKRVAIVGVVLTVGLVAQATAASSAGSPKVLEFDTMAPVIGPYVGTANPIRGIVGGGVPWQIDEGRGELRTNGSLEIEVDGLVLVATGTNPVTQFKVIVSCQTIEGSAATTTNVSTGTFPASESGDSKIEATVSLPDPCFAPIVFVTSAGGAWFAVTGL